MRAERERFKIDLEKRSQSREGIENTDFRNAHRGNSTISPSKSKIDPLRSSKLSSPVRDPVASVTNNDYSPLKRGGTH